MTLIAISAAYGAGGNVVAPALAERLSVPFVDRAIPMAVAERLHVSVDAANAHDEHNHSWLERALRGFIGGDVGTPTTVPADTITGEDFRRATEEALLRQAATGEGVILGRGSVLVLREDRRALRVRLSGPVEARIERAMQLGGLDRATAERTLRHLDRVHGDYARHFYDETLDDPSLYHVMLEATAFPPEVCVELLVSAAQAFRTPTRA
jgi:cytidylate kinase